MYVCVCRGVTDRHIKEAVNKGARSMRELRQTLGLCSDCGKCGTFAKDLLDELNRADLMLARPAA